MSRMKSSLACVVMTILVGGCGGSGNESAKDDRGKVGKASDPALVTGDSKTETVELVSPKSGLGDKASAFKWKKVDGAKSYQLVASNKDGKATWAQEVQGVEVEFPKWRETDSIATWSVTAIDGDGHVIAASGVRDW